MKLPSFRHFQDRFLTANKEKWGKDMALCFARFVFLTFRGSLASHDSNPYLTCSRIARYTMPLSSSAPWTHESQRFWCHANRSVKLHSFGHFLDVPIPDYQQGEVDLFRKVLVFDVSKGQKKAKNNFQHNLFGTHAKPPILGPQKKVYVISWERTQKRHINMNFFGGF